MNRYLFKKLFFVSTVLFGIILFSILCVSNTALASSTGPTTCEDLANGNPWQCVYPSFTSGTIPCTTSDGHYGYYNWKGGVYCPSDDSSKTQCAVCEPSGASDYTGSKLYGQAELQKAADNTSDCQYSCINSASLGASCHADPTMPGGYATDNQITTTPYGYWYQINQSCTQTGTTCAQCTLTPPTDSAQNGSGTPEGPSPTPGMQSNGTFYDPNTYCATHQCGVGPTIQGAVFVDANGDGSQDAKTQYCYDENKNKTCDTDETLYDSALSCFFAHFSSSCIKATGGDEGFAGATVTIGSIKTTTKSDGTFKVTLPLVTPAPTGTQSQTVTLTLPKGYSLTEKDGNTLSQTIEEIKGEYPKVNFAIQASTNSTITPTGETTQLTCDPNGDGKTDTKDLTIIENQWYGIDAGKTGDCNKDGVVNGLDFQMWKDISVVKLNNTTLY